MKGIISKLLARGYRGIAMSHSSRLSYIGAILAKEYNFGAETLGSFLG